MSRRRRERERALEGSARRFPVSRGGGYPANGSLLDIINRLGLATNLELCLDAGDSRSYNATGSWLDVSGHGYDFFLGDDAGADTDDPTFNGSIGGLSASEFFSFDGGDFFEYDTTNETWMDNIHKDNAAFTIALIFYWIGTGGSESLIGTSTSNLESGFSIATSSGSAILQFLMRNETGSAGANITTGTAGNLTSAGINLAGFSINEAAGSNGSHVFVNGASSLKDGTYTTPTANAAANVMQIGAIADGGKARSGTKVFGALAWSRSLSTTETKQLYDAVRARYSI